jgi:hypothetical protein
MRLALVSTLALATLASSAVAQSPVISGEGEAAITKDIESVRAVAEENAREDIVRNLARQAIGSERLGELSPDLIQRLAHQIRSEMIVDRSTERVGKTFKVTLSARVDPAWFHGLLQTENVMSSAEASQGDRQLIFVMIDENKGVAADYSKPAEIVTEYDHSQGASFRDKSVSAASEKDHSGHTFNGATASRVSVAGAAGYSDGYGSAAVRQSGAAASATTVRSASASSHSAASIDKTDVAAAEHDDTHFHQRITYQTAVKTGASNAARAGLTDALSSYGVSVANSDAELASYFNGRPPTYGSLLTSVQFKPFLTSLSQRHIAPFYMGGTLTVRYGARDPATGQATCSGELAATAFDTNSQQQIAEANPNATAMGQDPDNCAAKLSQSLAHLAADHMGPQIQNYWRTQLRSTARAAAVASGPANYTLTVKAASLTMAMQADLLDALSATPGVEKQVFLGQSANQVSFQVRYSGSLPLQMALFQQLRNKPGFAQMQPTSDGNSVVLCLSAC